MQRGSSHSNHSNRFQDKRHHRDHLDFHGKNSSQNQKRENYNSRRDAFSSEMDHSRKSQNNQINQINQNNQANEHNRNYSQSQQRGSSQSSGSLTGKHSQYNQNTIKQQSPWSLSPVKKLQILPSDLPNSVYNAVQLHLRLKELDNIFATEQKDQISSTLKSEYVRLLEEKDRILDIAPTFDPKLLKTSVEQKGSILTKKIYIPVKEFPNYKFIGLIIGPRGKTQKLLEKETGAKIAIRGDGSVPIEKIRMNPSLASEEPLHVLIQAPSEKSLQLATEMINELLIPREEGTNEIKRQQLRELAKIHGTLYDNIPQTDIFEGKASLRDTLKTLGAEKLKRSKKISENSSTNGLETEEMDTEMQEFIEHLVEDDADTMEGNQQDLSAQPPPPGTSLEYQPIFAMYEKYYFDTLKETYNNITKKKNEKENCPPISGVNLESENENDRLMIEIVSNVSSNTQKKFLFQKPTSDTNTEVKTLVDDGFVEDLDYYRPYEIRLNLTKSGLHGAFSGNDYEDVDMYESHLDSKLEEVEPEQLLEDAPWL